MDNSENAEQPKLKRHIGLAGLTIYGVGNILGAGIYSIIGEVLGTGGNASWLAFVLAALIGSFTGLSYAELSAMYTESAAEFVYVEQAFKNRTLSFTLGWIVIFSGLFSSATVSLVFAGYLADLLNLPYGITSASIAIVLILVLSLINYIGIRESTWTNILFTLIEASGIILIIAIGIPNFGTVDYFQFPTGITFLTFLPAVALVFFAYIGFEDIANVAEEVREPERNLPKAIILAVLITTILYVLTAISVVSILPYSDIAGDPAPLNTVASAVLGPTGGLIMSIIAMFATANTVLIILIVTSRMMYGMARDKALPEKVGLISAKRKTPWVAIILTMSLTGVFAVAGGLTDITVVANATVIGVFIAFALVNISLIVLRKTKHDKSRSFKSPSVKGVPILAILGAASCIAILLVFNVLTVIIQIIIIAVGVLIYVALRPAICCEPTEKE